MEIGNAGMSADSATDLIRQRKEEIFEKVKTGDTEPKIQIGGTVLTQKQWDKLMKRVDDSIDEEEEKSGEEDSANDVYQRLSLSSDVIKDKMQLSH